MFFRQRSTQGSYGAVKTILVQGNGVHITFHQDEIPQLALLGQVQTEEVFAFIENESLRRVQILGGGIVHHSAAETDDIAPGIDDGEHEPVAEPIVNSSVFLRHQACILQFLVRIAFGAHGLAQAVPGIGGKADAEFGEGSLGHAALLGVGKALCALGGIELPVEIAGSLLHQRPKALLLTVAALVLLVLGHFHARTLGQGTDRIGIAETFHFHHKVDGTAALMAAEAIVDALIGGHRERRGLFSVEGAKAKEVCTGAS